MRIIAKPLTLLFLASFVALVLFCVRTRYDASPMLLFVQLPFVVGCIVMCRAMVRQNGPGLAFGALLWGVATVGLLTVGSLSEALRLSFSGW